jgi:hypothetical protein
VYYVIGYSKVWYGWIDGIGLGIVLCVYVCVWVVLIVVLSRLQVSVTGVRHPRLRQRFHEYFGCDKMLSYV